MMNEVVNASKTPARRALRGRFGAAGLLDGVNGLADLRGGDTAERIEDKEEPGRLLRTMSVHLASRGAAFGPANCPGGFCGHLRDLAGYCGNLRTILRDASGQY
jgi:hypothetical protein